MTGYYMPDDPRMDAGMWLESTGPLYDKAYIDDVTEQMRKAVSACRSAAIVHPNYDAGAWLMHIECNVCYPVVCPAAAPVKELALRLVAERGGDSGYTDQLMSTVFEMKPYPDDYWIDMGDGVLIAREYAETHRSQAPKPDQIKATPPATPITWWPEDAPWDIEWPTYTPGSLAAEATRHPRPTMAAWYRDTDGDKAKLITPDGQDWSGRVKAKDKYSYGRPAKCRACGWPAELSGHVTGQPCPDLLTYKYLIEVEGRTIRELCATYDRGYSWIHSRVAESGADMPNRGRRKKEPALI